MKLPDYPARHDSLRNLFFEHDIDAFLITKPHNIYYLCGATGGYSGARVALVVNREGSILCIDKRYLEETLEEAHADEFVPWTKPSFKPISSVVTELGVQALGIESEDITIKQFEYMKVDFEEITLCGTSGLVESLRQIKDRYEIDAIREAAAIADKGFEYIIDLIKPGISELEIATELDYFIKRHGSERPSFDTIIAAGEHSAVPHAKPGNRLVKNGDFIKLDFGAMINGYHSDMTRTVVLGRASDKQEELYYKVLEAQTSALAHAINGKPCHEIDDVARSILESSGYGENFVHGLGHGVGLEIHEAPTLTKGNEKLLKTGHVVTIEPGVYISGFGGVRIEDLVVIDKDNPQILSHSTKDLLEL